MSHDLNLYFIHLPQCALFRRIKGPNSGFVPSRPQTRKTDANRSQCRRMPPKSPKKCSVMMCDVGCHIQCGFSKNSEGATIFGTPAESASEQWVAHTHTHSPTHTQDSSKTCLPLSLDGMNHVHLTTTFPSVRKTMGNSLWSFQKVQTTPNKLDTRSNTFFFFPEEHRKPAVMQRSTICAGNQKGNKNLV